MKSKFFHQNQKGFTLIELLSIMIIMGVMSSVAVQKFDTLSDTASKQALAWALKELNTRESLIWTNIKLSDDGWTDDSAVFAAVEKQGAKGPAESAIGPAPVRAHPAAAAVAETVPRRAKATRQVRQRRVQR